MRALLFSWVNVPDAALSCVRLVFRSQEKPAGNRYRRMLKRKNCLSS